VSLLVAASLKTCRFGRVHTGEFSNLPPQGSTPLDNQIGPPDYQVVFMRYFL
jgi:hypothetical protein